MYYVTVYLIVLCMLNLLTYLKQDWINFGVTRIYFMITMHAEIKGTGRRSIINL